jgi:hypothetical protein
MFSCPQVLMILKLGEEEEELNQRIRKNVIRIDIIPV